MAEADDVLVIPHNPPGEVSAAACGPMTALLTWESRNLNGAEDAMVKTPGPFDAEKWYLSNERSGGQALL